MNIYFKNVRATERVRPRSKEQPRPRYIMKISDLGFQSVLNDTHRRLFWRQVVSQVARLWAILGVFALTDHAGAQVSHPRTFRPLRPPIIVGTTPDSAPRCAATQPHRNSAGIDGRSRTAEPGAATPSDTATGPASDPITERVNPQRDGVDCARPGPDSQWPDDEPLGPSERTHHVDRDPPHESQHRVCRHGAGRKVYRTLDGGTTWTQLMDNAQTLAIGAVAIDPVTPSTLFVGTGEGEPQPRFIFRPRPLHQSRNADSASPTLTGPFESRTNGGSGHAFLNTSITQIVFDPTNDNNVFIGNTFPEEAASPGRRLKIPLGFGRSYYCANAQAATPTFVRVTNLPGGGAAPTTDIVREPGNPNNLVVGVEDVGGRAVSGIYSTINALTGATSTWTRTRSSNPENIKLGINKVGATVTVLAALDESSGTVLKSTDGGATFPTTLSAVTGFCGGQGFYDMVVTLDPANASIIYVGGSADGTTTHITHESRSTGERSFTPSTVGLHLPTRHAVKVAPSNSSVVYFGSDGGIWKSTDAGANWTSLNNATFSATQFQSIAVHPKRPLLHDRGNAG